jgi:CelD/BcsL family acetyltransferase involved in cellulose biosynthesis
VPNSAVEIIPWTGDERRKPDRQLERRSVSRSVLDGELSGLTITTVTNAAELDSLRIDYEQLNRASLLALPFTLYEWQSAWCEHFLAADELIQDSMLIYVVRTKHGRCVAIVPMIRTRRSLGPFEVSTLNLLGADEALTEIRVPLIAPGFQATVARLVERQLAMIERWDWIQWSGATPALARGLTGSANLHWQQPLMDYVLDLPADWESFRKSLKRNIRESLRHCYNSLKRDGLEFSLLTLARPEEMEAGLDQFLRLHAMRAGLEGTIAHPDYFVTPTAQAFLRDVCARLAARDICRVFQLVVNGQVVATRIGFLMGDTLYLYYSGFDSAWARYSVMTTTVAEIIKLSISQRVRTVNLSPGADVGKTRWGPREIPIGQLLQVDRRLRSRIARSAYEQATGPDTSNGWIAKLLRGVRRRWS